VKFYTVTLIKICLAL